MNPVLGGIDAFLCVLVVVAVVDYLRRVRPIEQPLLSISFYLVGIGTFGDFAAAILGQFVSPYTVMIHAGIVVYAWARRVHIFEASA
jgi:hypothetical protein